MTDAINRLHTAVLHLRQTRPSSSRTVKLMAGGRAKMAKKLVEEATEVTMDAVADDRSAVVRESADLIYNLTVLWADMGIAPDEVWREMERRERLYGLAEKLHKGPVAVAGGRKAVTP